MAAPNPLLVILIVVVIALLCIAVLLTVVLILKRMRLKKRKFEISNTEKSGQFNAGFHSNGEQDGAQVTSVNPLPDTNNVQSMPAPAAPTLEMDPILLTVFTNYVADNKMNGALVDQWSSLPQDLTQSATVAMKSENRAKNRYRNIIAYDNSRVVLDIVDGDNFSDYVNASFMEGHGSNKAYIASQGPTTNSIEDFWRMVWQENIRKISMVANVIEDGRMKCLHYWPELGDEMLMEGDFTITTESEEVRDSYTLRHIILQKKAESSRTIYQFHYTEWPDRDVPSDASTLIRYIQDIHNTGNSKEGSDTLLIHCSAGAGRTGVLMSIDSQLQRAGVKGDVNIYNYALAMRRARPWMIQMPIQFIFIHEALVEALMCKDTLIHKSKLASFIDRFNEPQFETGKMLIEQHFEALNAVSVKVTDYFYQMQSGKKIENLEKNRFSALIPIDRFRPKLMVEDEDDDVRNYICATFLNRHTKVNGFMATQMPLSNTLANFWQLVLDYKVTAIVMLNEFNENDTTMQQYWPSSPKDILVTDLFSITEVSSEDKGHYIIRDMTLKVVVDEDLAEGEEMNEELTVRQFQYTKWPVSSKNPTSVSAFLDFIISIKNWMKEDKLEVHLPLIHCINGIGRTGVFCSVFNTLEQLEKQDSVNIFNIIKALRRKQPLLIETQTEYELVFRLVNLYILQSELSSNNNDEGGPTYSNFVINGGADVDDVPVEDVPVEDAPIGDAPVEDAPVEDAPVEDAPVEDAPVEDAPVEDAPVEDAPVENSAIANSAIANSAIANSPAEDSPIANAPAEDADAEYEVIEATAGEDADSYDIVIVSRESIKESESAISDGNKDITNDEEEDTGF